MLTLDQQAQRSYQQLQGQDSDLAKNVYLEQRWSATPFSQPGAALLPAVENLRGSSATAAIAVARAAAADGVATKSHDDLVQAVQDAMWQTVYA